MRAHSNSSECAYARMQIADLVRNEIPLQDVLFMQAIDSLCLDAGTNAALGKGCRGDRGSTLCLPERGATLKRNPTNA